MVDAGTSAKSTLPAKRKASSLAGLSLTPLGDVKMKPSITIQELEQLQADMGLVRNGNFNSMQYNILDMLKIIEQRKLNENLKSLIDAIKDKKHV